MHCVNDDGHELKICTPECPLRRRVEEQERQILNLLPETYPRLCQRIAMPEDLMLLLCHLEYYGCVTRDDSGYYHGVKPLPTITECPFLLFEE